MMPVGKINLAYIEIVIKSEMLTEIMSSFETVRTFITRDFLLHEATDLNMAHHCYLPGKTFRTGHFVASYTQTIIIIDLQRVIF